MEIFLNESLVAALIMFDWKKKKQLPFGTVRPTDDNLIEVSDLRREARRGLFGESLRLLRDIVLIIVVFILFGVFIAQPVVVEGTSMLPQLKDGERLLVNKLIYYDIKSTSWGHIERGDIVVFWFPNDPDKSFVKRVIGLPGEIVEIRAGKVLINNQELHEYYLTEEFNQTLPSFAPKRVDEHHYFVLGDNRDNSSDSRYWGLVPTKYIYGKAFFRYWKPENMGAIEHADYGEFKSGPSSSDSEEEVKER